MKRILLHFQYNNIRMAFNSNKITFQYLYRIFNSLLPKRNSLPNFHDKSNIRTVFLIIVLTHTVPTMAFHVGHPWKKRDEPQLHSTQIFQRFSFSTTRSPDALSRLARKNRILESQKQGNIKAENKNGE